MFHHITKAKPVQLILPVGETVKKANKLVRAKLNFEETSVFGPRLLAGLISCIKTEDTEFKEIYSIAVKDIIKEFDEEGSGKSYQRVKSICDNLIKASVFLEEIDEDANVLEPRWINFFEEVRYSNGVISAIFTRAMGPFLLNMRAHFTQYNLIEYLRLSTFYSQRLYELLKSWSNLSSFTIKIDELHDIMSSPISARKNYKDFRAKIFERACKEIESKTELRFTWKPIRRGEGKIRNGKVSAIEFTFPHSPVHTPLPSIGREACVMIADEKQLRKKLSYTEQLVEKAAECSGYIGAAPCNCDNEKEVCEVCKKRCSRWNQKLIESPKQESASEWIEALKILKTKVSVGEFDLWISKLSGIKTGKGLYIAWQDQTCPESEIHNNLQTVREKYDKIIKDALLQVGIKEYNYVLRKK